MKMMSLHDANLLYYDVRNILDLLECVLKVSDLSCIYSHCFLLISSKAINTYAVSNKCAENSFD